MKEKKTKALFPDNVETITISKNDYDRLYGELTDKNIVLHQELDQYKNIIKEVREYVKKLKNYKIKYMMFEEKELYASENDFVKELLEILDKEKE